MYMYCIYCTCTCKCTFTSNFDNITWEYNEALACFPPKTLKGKEQKLKIGFQKSSQRAM